MAKPKKKKTKVKKIEDVKRRSWIALSALLHTGGGKHQDRRTKRARTRNARERAAITESCD